MKVIYDFNEEEKNVTITQNFKEHEEMIETLIMAQAAIRYKGDLELSDQLEKLRISLRNWKARWEL